MTPEQRQTVAGEARRWLGTPYHHNARLLGVGVDCALLPAAVYEAAGVIEHVDPKYCRDWHLHRSGEQYVDWVIHTGGREITREEADTGDLVLWRWGRTFSHGAIIVDRPNVIHAWLGLGVTQDNMDQHTELSSREARFFTMGAG